ncbi:hypothetical protein D3C78_641150 [compost metagenome]
MLLRMVEILFQGSVCYAFAEGSNTTGDLSERLMTVHTGGHGEAVCSLVELLNGRTTTQVEAREAIFEDAPQLEKLGEERIIVFAYLFLGCLKFNQKFVGGYRSHLREIYPEFAESFSCLRQVFGIRFKFGFDGFEVHLNRHQGFRQQIQLRAVREFRII